MSIQNLSDKSAFPHNLLVKPRRVKTNYSYAITISTPEENFEMQILKGYDQYLP